MENNLQTPLTEPQLDLLRMFSYKVDAADWLAIKRMIVHYFAQKAIEGADKGWDEEGWDDKKVDDLLNTHLRTPYTSAKH